MEKLEAHKYCKLLPELSKRAYASLRDDIHRRGLLDKIMLWPSEPPTILDGRHRYKACLETGKKPQFETFNGTDAQAFDFVYSRSQHREWTDAKKLLAAARFAECHKSEAIARQKSGKRADPNKKGRSSDLAGHQFGFDGRAVRRAQRILKFKEIAAKVDAGKMSICAAELWITRKERSARMDRLAQDAPRLNADDCKIIGAEWREGMEQLPARSVRLIATDPPYNNGTDYGSGKKADSLTPEKYLAGMSACFDECRRILTNDGAMWVLIDDRWAGHYAVMLEKLFTIRSWIIWYETFGVNCADNFNRCSRHLFYCIKNASNFVFHREVFQRDSDRAKVYVDSRAANGGKKMWDSVWGVPGVEPRIPRIVGSAAERVEAPTQVPLALMEPIIRGCSDPGDTVFDPFTGTGTTAVAAIINGRKFVGTEREKEYVELAERRVRVAAMEARK